MATGAKKMTMRDANLRHCRLCKWSNYNGLGFNLKPGSNAPYSVSIVESNSPAAAAGLKINDVILAVNKNDMTKVKYDKLTQAIQKARDKNNTVDLLVMEKHIYEQVLKSKTKIVPKEARTISAPETMPQDFATFPKHVPRTCDVRLTDPNQSFGFVVVNAENDMGVFIQEVQPNTPASNAGLRKSDRIITIDDEFVDDKPSDFASKKIREAKANMSVKLYVMDTQTYRHFKTTKPSLLPSQTYENVPTTRPTNSTPYNNDSDTDTSAPTAPVRPISTQDSSRGIDALVKKPPPPYNKPADSLPLASSDDEDDSKTTTTVRQQSSVQPSYGISAIGKNNPVVADTSRDVVQEGRRKYQLRRDPKLGFGFTVKYLPINEYHHKITDITAGSPAAQKGLRVDDYVLTVNNRNVQNMNGDDFKTFLRSSATEAESRGEPLSLEVMNEDAILSRRSSSSEDDTKIISPTGTVTLEPSADDVYPTLRRCTVRTSSKNSDIGFKVIQSSYTVNGNAGFQISQLKSNSPASRANLANLDYIIEVNGRNIEHDDFEDLREEIIDTYKNDKKIELLVIDEDGYQWYKTRRYRIDLRAPEAKVTLHRTPDSPRESSASETYMNQTKHPYVPSEPSTLHNIHSSGSPVKDKPGEQPTSPHGTNQTVSTFGEKNNSSNAYGGGKSSHSKYGQSSTQQAGTSLSVEEKVKDFSRAGVNVVSDRRVFRSYHITLRPGEGIGCKIANNNSKYIIHDIKPNSPADSVGLQENDRIIEISHENVENKSYEEVLNKIRTAKNKGSVELLIVPSNIMSLTNRSEKSLDDLDDERVYNNLPSHSSSKRNNNELNGNRSYSIDDLRNFSFEPKDPRPRKCLLIHDPNFDGCGFRVMEKANYDTPIVVEVCPNSPAKRSGLSEGDHIVYIQSKNIQNFRTFDEKVDYIKHEFERTDRVELVTLTGPAFKALKRKGGDLEITEFDYNTLDDNIRPRLFKLTFQAHESDYGLSFDRENLLYIKQVEPRSVADVNGIHVGDIVLELNGQDAKYLSKEEIQEIVKTSRQNRSLDILIIDLAGYKYATKHAIPLNSCLPLVRKQKQPGSTSGDRQKEAVYL